MYSSITPVVVAAIVAMGPTTAPNARLHTIWIQAATADPVLSFQIVYFAISITASNAWVTTTWQSIWALTPFLPFIVLQMYPKASHLNVYPVRSMDASLAETSSKITISIKLSVINVCLVTDFSITPAMLIKAGNTLIIQPRAA